MTTDILLTKEKAAAVVLLGGIVEPYDPTMNCDNKCLRLGYCRFGCPEYRLVAAPDFGKVAP